MKNWIEAQFGLPARFGRDPGRRFAGGRIRMRTIDRMSAFRARSGSGMRCSDGGRRTVVERARGVHGRPNDLLRVGGALATLIAATNRAAQASEVMYTLFGDSASNLSVGNLLADANVHRTPNNRDSEFSVMRVRTIINSAVVFR